MYTSWGTVRSETTSDLRCCVIWNVFVKCWIAFSKVSSSFVWNFEFCGTFIRFPKMFLCFSELCFYKHCCVVFRPSGATVLLSIRHSFQTRRKGLLPHTQWCLWAASSVFSDNGFSRRLEQIIKLSPNLSCSIIYFSFTRSLYIKLLFCLNITKHATSDRALELSGGWQHHTLQCHTWA